LIRPIALQPSQAIVLRGLALLAVAILLVPSAGARSDCDSQPVAKLDQPASFHITSGSLESGLLQFSRQAKIQVVVGTLPISDIIVTPLNGRLTGRAALLALLKGTGYIYTTVGNTVTIQPAPSKGSEPASSERMPTHVENATGPTAETPRTP
jgi:hypothetical protein